MKVGKCIYCRANTELNKEHAFLDSLRQKNTPHWTIDNHVCVKCNSDFGSQIDVVLSKCSTIAFLFDLIQREFGQEETSQQRSIYNNVRSGVRPIRMLFPNPVYDNLFVLHKSHGVNHQQNYMEVTALQPQMILTQYPQGKTCEEIVTENNRKYNTNKAQREICLTHDTLEDVISVFKNTYIFPPKKAHYYMEHEDEFKSKYMSEYPHMQYNLRTIFPEHGQGEQKFQDFFNKINAETKLIIAEDKNLPPEVFRNPIQTIMDRRGKKQMMRAIVKLAFHCFLYHYPEYTGHERMFNGVKNFISRGSGSTSRYVWTAETDKRIANGVYEGDEHQHFFSFFLGYKQIGCEIHLFTGLNSPAFSFGIVLAGKPNKIPLKSDSVKMFPFRLHQKSSLKKRLEPTTTQSVLISKGGIIKPCKMSDLYFMRKTSVDCSTYP